MTTPVAKRVEKRRMALRMAGLRPIQIWVPDTRLPGFAAECARQSQLANDCDLTDADLFELMESVMDGALNSTDSWTA